MNILLIHGNGGASSRFQLFLDKMAAEQPGGIEVFIPQLPGFEGRPLPKGKVAWDIFLQPLQELIEMRADQPWLFYGHGIGGSLLMEWAARDFVLLSGQAFHPDSVVLHAPIGASLAHRWFPKVMKFKGLRSLIHWLIYQKWLQQKWEKKLFLHPKKISSELKDRFFSDYKNCSAFPHFFDLIDEKWYAEVQQKISHFPFYFLWGAKERVVASRFLGYWKKDFPAASFELVEEWDHFPMLEDSGRFFTKIMERAAAAANKPNK